MTWDEMRKAAENLGLWIELHGELGLIDLQGFAMLHEAIEAAHVRLHEQAESGGVI